MGPPTAASQSVKQVGVEGSDPTDTDTERGGSADEAKKVIRLQYFELNPDLGITPTDCESRNENKLTWQCRRGRRRGVIRTFRSLSLLPCSRRPDVSSYHCRGHESDVEDEKT